MTGPLAARDRVLLRRDGHRARRGRPADPRQRRREPGRAPRRRRAGSCPRSRRGPTCAGSCPSLDEALADAGVDWSRRRRGRRDLAARGSPARCSSGINFAKTLAWVARQAARRRQPPRGPRLRGAGCSTRARTSASAPAVPARRAGRVAAGTRSSSRCATTSTYRLLGTTVDDAAGEAFDKVGRLLGPRLPGRPGDQRARPRRATAHDRVFPRAWLGDSYDFSFSGLKTAARRIVDEARAEAGLAGRRRRAAPLPDGRVAELAWGFQDSVVDVLATKTIRAAEADRRPRDRAGRRRRRERRAPGAARRRGATARGLRVVVPRPGLCTDNGAMIGAAGARRFAAGDRAGARPRRDGPSLPLAAR